MKFQYYPETDSLYIDLTGKPGADSVEVSPGVVVDLDNEEHIVGIDIDNASTTVDMSRLETVALPFDKLNVLKEVS